MHLVATRHVCERAQGTARDKLRAATRGMKVVDIWRFDVRVMET
jgi:hypothetical protein